jgi:hypothetical protein
MRPVGTQDERRGGSPVYWARGGSYNPLMRGTPSGLFLCGLLQLLSVAVASLPAGVHAATDELQIAVSKKGLGKEVVITQGAREWFMLVEVTPENTVIVRQEKDRDAYLLDESETHDRPLAPVEVDAAINDYINSVKARVPKQ